MRVSRIATIDSELNFMNVEVNCENQKELDKCIENSCVVEIEENGTKYHFNSSYILFYEL